jgi:hypothetical protein
MAATAAEPGPAELPLPGGRPGATVGFHPLVTGRFVGPRARYLREKGRMAWRRALGYGVPRRQWLQVPVPAFLVEHPGVGPILVDTGLHPSVAVKPNENFGRLTLFAFKDLRTDLEQAAPAQLRARGIEPASVGLVVMTHLHLDHASAISEFPEATFVVSKAEREAATSGCQFQGSSGASSTTPSTTACSTSRVPRPSRSPASGARSTCSATGACAASTRRATRSGTCRSWYACMPARCS